MYTVQRLWPTSSPRNCESGKHRTACLLLSRLLARFGAGRMRASTSRSLANSATAAGACRIGGRRATAARVRVSSRVHACAPRGPAMRAARAHTQSLILTHQQSSPAGTRTRIHSASCTGARARGLTAGGTLHACLQDHEKTPSDQDREAPRAHRTRVARRVRNLALQAVAAHLAAVADAVPLVGAGACMRPRDTTRFA